MTQGASTPVGGLVLSKYLLHSPWLQIDTRSGYQVGN
jgi:hypothetical protein